MLSLMKNQHACQNDIQNRVEGQPMSLRMLIILSTLRVRSLLMRSNSWVENSPSCICYGWAMYWPPSKPSFPLLASPWTASKMDWRGSNRVSRQICGRYSPGNSTWNFMGIYFINMYAFLFHLFLFLQSFQFQKGMNTERSNSSSWIRSHLGPQIFGYCPESFAQASWRLDHCHEIVGWVQPPNQEPFYNPFAPILYRDYQGQQDIKALFLNKALFDVRSLFAHCHSL